MDLSVTTGADRTNRLTLDTHAYLAFATLLYGLSVISASPGAGFAVLLATGLAAVAFARIQPEGDVSATGTAHQRELRLLVVVLVFAGLDVLGWAPPWVGTTTEWLERLPGLAWAVLAAGLYSTRHRSNSRRALVVVTGATLILSLVVGYLHLDGARDVGTDVWLLHREAAAAIADGQNPYTEVVGVPDGSPFASASDTIVGYTYPPSMALVYSIGQWTLGDPRYTSLTAWLLVLGMVGWVACRRESRSSAYVMLALASIPGWPLVLRAAWTEPVTLAFITAAFIWWRRPTRSGIALGLALTSKQYFVVTAPLLLLHRDARWFRRLVVAGLVAVLTLVPVVLLDPMAFWSSAVEFHNQTGFRPDSINVAGALSALWSEWSPPRWLGPALGVVVAVITGRVSRSRETFLLGMALALAASFLVAPQAFGNYWFLIAGMCALCLADLGGEPDVADDR